MNYEMYMLALEIGFCCLDQHHKVFNAFEGRIIEAFCTDFHFLSFLLVFTKNYLQELNRQKA